MREPGGRLRRGGGAAVGGGGLCEGGNGGAGAVGRVGGGWGWGLVGWGGVGVGGRLGWGELLFLMGWILCQAKSKGSFGLYFLGPGSARCLFDFCIMFFCPGSDSFSTHQCFKKAGMFHGELLFPMGRRRFSGWLPLETTPKKGTLIRRHPPPIQAPQVMEVAAF